MLLHQRYLRRYQERNHLLASPQGLRLDDGGHGKVPVLVFDQGLHPHQQIHDLLPSEEDVPAGHEVYSQKCVLDDSHDGCVVFGSYDLLGHVGNVLELCDRLY